MREVNRLLARAHLESRGSGDVGPAIDVADTADPKVPKVHSDRRLHRREIKTIFGEIVIRRYGYGYGAREQLRAVDQSHALERVLERSRPARPASITPGEPVETGHRKIATPVLFSLDAPSTEPNSPPAAVFSLVGECGARASSGRSVS